MPVSTTATITESFAPGLISHTRGMSSAAMFHWRWANPGSFGVALVRYR